VDPRNNCARFRGHRDITRLDAYFFFAAFFFFFAAFFALAMTGSPVWG
jgi:hypothetical protein